MGRDEDTGPRGLFDPISPPGRQSHVPAGSFVRTWVHHEPGAGYVAFKWWCVAQFVMEAMQGRSLAPEGGTPLALSWALRDPGQEQVHIEARAPELV